MKCSNVCLFLTVLLFGLFGHQVFCLNKSDNKKEKPVDLTAEASLYEPSYQYQPPPPTEHSSSYKNYNDGRDAYGKYNKAYGDNGYNHYGNQDRYVDQGYADHALKKYNDYGAKDKYGGQSAHYAQNYGQGLYQRDRGYGYEKAYSYDKTLSTKNYGAEHADKASNYGDHAKYDHSGLYSHGSSGHHKSGDNKKYAATGHNQYGHSNGLYGDHSKHYGSAGKAYHLSTPYTHYSSNYEPQTHYEPASYPVYPAYKPAVYKPDPYYQQAYHDEPVAANSPVAASHSGAPYEPNVQSTYISHGAAQHSGYPSASTAYASHHSALHPGVAYY